MDDPGALGAALKRLRDACGRMTQEALAHACQVHRTYITHVEAGRFHPPRSFWVAADNAVAAGGALLAAYDAIVVQHPAVAAGRGIFAGRPSPVAPVAALLGAEFDSDLERWLSVNRRQVMRLLGVAGTLPAASLLAALEQPVREHLVYALANRADAAAIDRIETVLDAVARQYEEFGPKAVLSVRQGQADIIEALMRDCPDTLRPRLLSVRGALSRTLGWMAYDSGDYPKATSYYESARKDAQDAGNPALKALVLCNMSLAATRDDDPHAGLDHAVTAAYWARARAGDKYLYAYSRDMAAEAHAELGDTRECLTVLDDARTALDSAPSATLPSYVYDPALSAGFAAESLTKLGLAAEAIDAGQRCVDLFDPSYALSRGFADIGLAAALTAGRQYDRATDIVLATAAVADAYGSPRLAGEVLATGSSIRQQAPRSQAARLLADLFGESV
ncbi:helix-turn-helix transcriptional regulator [Nocardia sp. alder85J]|uniref:helix-turn-helix transcriptional regulator n=1 Tax=Nocardia sp. alder85J TaxID=2862949 RepID=UPI001CD4E900|nr:helix-turn-helix transcriptional regulator [Nocardia sp. alder85J]MCX4097771.1 helix-turn-helix transcriptional regulator [Nocardia sp. alder85J]